jgi:hypothetical protein
MPGVWEATGSNCVAGIGKIRARRRRGDRTHSPRYPIAARSQLGGNSSSNNSSMRNRKTASGLRRTGLTTSLDTDIREEQAGDWQAWTMNAVGDINTTPLGTAGTGTGNVVTGDEGALFVTMAGAAARVGQKLVAIAFGRSVKLLHIGSDVFSQGDDNDTLGPWNMAPHRRSRGKKPTLPQVGTR